MKVLIVEDEYLVRVGLRSSIDWQENGFTLLADATNGEEAIIRIQEELPYIILLDIRIPKIDGIEVLKYIKQQKLNCKVIIISCHDEFSIVREALQLGAIDYLHKLSMKSSDILEVLLKVKNSFSDIAPDISDSNNDPQILDDQLADIIMNNKIDLQISDKLNIGYSMYIDMDSHKCFYTIKANVILNLIRQIIKSFGKDCCIFNIDYSSFYVAVLGNNTNESVAEKVRDQMLNTTGISLSIGVGPIWKDTSEIKHSFEIAQNIIFDKFYQGYRLVRIYSQDNYSIQQSSDLLQVHQNINKLIEVKKSNEILLYIKSIFEDVRISHNYYPDIVKTACIDAFNIITNNFFKDHFECEKLNIFRTIMSSQTLEALEDYFIEQIEMFINKSNIKQSQIHSPIMKNALKFISENIYTNITLSELSKKINVSESYLSMLFHKEMGENFITYLNRQKINIAKDLLQGDCLIYEVAERLGFDSSSYFSKVFKKYTGITPEQYRSKN